MAFGASIKNTNGEFLLSSDYPLLSFIGKASYQSIFRNVDMPSVGRVWFSTDPDGSPPGWRDTTSGGKYSSNTPDYSHDETQYLPANLARGVYVYLGYDRLTSPGTTGRFNRYDFVYVDNVGIATYYIGGSVTPSVFIHSAAGYSGAVISTRGVSGGFYIQVLVSYPTGASSSVGSNILLYCFGKVADTPSGYGMSIYGSDGNVLYSTNKPPLLVKDILTINSISTGAEASTSADWYLHQNQDVAVTGVPSGRVYTSLNINSSTVTGAATTIPKPAFLSVDWLRFRFVTSSGNARTYCFTRSDVGCSADSKATVSYTAFATQMGICTGVSIVAGAVKINLSATAHFLGSGATTKTNQTTVSEVHTASLPVSFPVIDASQYDT